MSQSVCLALSIVMMVSLRSRGMGPTCDAVLRHAFPDLCEFDVTQGNLTVRGLRLVFWRYTARKKSPDEDTTSKLPIVMVHGGPSMTHSYILPMKQQACRGREVVFYDQIGCGESSQPANVRESAPWLFTVEYYLEELRTLVDFLGWEAFHFFGNSWGTIVGQAYALDERDPRLKGIVLSGPISDAKLYIRSQWDPVDGSLGSMPLFVQSEIHKLDSTGLYKGSVFTQLDSVLTAMYTCRTVPMPDCVRAAESAVSAGTPKEIYVGMQGASEFTIGGVLATMNYTSRLNQVLNPVLLTHGKYDTMRPATVDALYDNLPRVWKAMMPRSGHMSMVDDPLLMNNVVGDFFDAVEADGLAKFNPSLVAEDGTLPKSGLERTWPVLALHSYFSLAVGVLLGSCGATLFWERKGVYKASKISGLSSECLRQRLTSAVES